MFFKVCSNSFFCCLTAVAKCLLAKSAFQNSIILISQSKGKKSIFPNKNHKKLHCCIIFLHGEQLCIRSMQKNLHEDKLLDPFHQNKDPTPFTVSGLVGRIFAIESYLRLFTVLPSSCGGTDSFALANVNVRSWSVDAADIVRVIDGAVTLYEYVQLFSAIIHVPSLKTTNFDTGTLSPIPVSTTRPIGSRQLPLGRLGGSPNRLPTLRSRQPALCGYIPQGVGD